MFTFIIPLSQLVLLLHRVQNTATEPDSEVKRHIKKMDLSYDDHLSKGQLKIVIYCECKSTLKIKFHTEKCIQKNSQIYSNLCMFSADKKKKSCRHFKKKLTCESNTQQNITERNLDEIYRLCGTRKQYKMYNTKKSFCCGGVIHSKRKHQQCCGNTTIIKSKELCCFEKPYLRASAEEKCCGESVYNSSTHFCLSNKTFLADESSYNVTVQQQYVEENVSVPSVEFEAEQETQGQQPHGSSVKWLPVILGTLILVVLTVVSIMKRCKLKYKQQTDEGVVKAYEDPPDLQHPDRHRSDVDGPVLSEHEERPPDIFTVSSLSYHHSEMSLPSSCTTSEMAHADYSRASSVTVAQMYNHETGNQEDTSRMRRCSGESLYSKVTLTWSDFMKNILKDKDIKTENFTQNLVKESSTQTCDEKETNRRDIFGNPFQLSCFLTQEKPTIQLKNSDAKMTLPEKDLKSGPIEVHASSHTTLPEIRQKLNTEKDHCIISPCMEYDLPYVSKLEDYAVIELKLASRTSGQIQVWRRESETDGKIVEVPIVKSFNPGLDTFCIVERGKATVYTLVFSTYVCTQHNDKEIELWGVLYAEMSPWPVRATLVLYVVERLHTEIKDYKIKLDEEEQRYDRRRIEHRKIPLPPSVMEKDMLTLKLSIDDRDQWDFIRDPHNTDTEIQYDITNQPIESSKSTWKMENKDGTKPEMFRCHLYTTLEQEANVEQKANVRFIPWHTVDKQLTQVSQDQVRRELKETLPQSINQRIYPRRELSNSDF